MKKILGLLLTLLFLTGCDDGDMAFQTFHFGTELTVCNETTRTYIAVNSSTKEVLVINFPAAALLNTESAKDANNNYIPTSYTLSQGQIEYRVYSGSTPTASNVCSGVDNPNISIKDRWVGTGEISVVTAKTSATQFSHSITLVNASFAKGDQTIRIEDNYLGTVTSNLGFNFDFTENETSQSFFSTCNDGRLFLANSKEAILLTLASGTFNNVPGSKTISTDSNNFARFRVYENSGINNTVICNGALTPVLEQEWITTEGSAQILIVTTESTSSPGQFLNDIYLVNAKFFNVTGSGEAFTPTPNDSTDNTRYYLGRYVSQ